MPKACQINATTSWFKAAFSNILYNHYNLSGLKIQPLIRINNWDCHVLLPPPRNDDYITTNLTVSVPVLFCNTNW